MFCCRDGIIIDNQKNKCNLLLIMIDSRSWVICMLKEKRNTTRKVQGILISNLLTNFNRGVNSNAALKQIVEIAANYHKKILA